MAVPPSAGKLYALFTLGSAKGRFRDLHSRAGGFRMVGGIAIAMFVALVAWGGRYFGWDDPDGKVQLALATSFILGIIGGYKARG
jgi:hypothetical protein